MSTALHLAPLVDAGLIRGPVDVYESTVVRRRKRRGPAGGGEAGDDGPGSEVGGCLRQRHPGSGAMGRDIGVGIWSTAWWPYLRSLSQGAQAKSKHRPAGDDDDEQSRGGSSGTDGRQDINNSGLSDLIQRQKDRQSYKTLLQDLEACGSYVGDVGYRTPDGGWLVRYELNSSPYGIDDLLLSGNEGADGPVGDIVRENPALLFVRERDLLSCLRNAVRAEGRKGTIRYHSGVTVEGVANVRGDLGSLVLRRKVEGGESSIDRGETDGEEVTNSPRYNMILAADGLYSTLRSKYAGHHSIHATSVGIESSSSFPGDGYMSKTMEYEQWEHTKGQCEATLVEERGYVVFRGNAPKLERDEEDGSGSFQTWGEEGGQRFAAVPFYHATSEDLEGDDAESGDGSGSGADVDTKEKASPHYSKSRPFITEGKADEEVWFATISESSLGRKLFPEDGDGKDSIPDAEERKAMLLEAFGDWHRPVPTLIRTTPAESIMYEAAVSHRHNATPVFDLGRIMEFEAWRRNRRGVGNVDGGAADLSPPVVDGRGPIMAFIGDSMMAVDPVLAQGFTMAMEAGYSLAASIERAYVERPPAGAAGGAAVPAYDPAVMRAELLERHYRRETRLLHLLRSTELVQRLAQPTGLMSVLSKYAVRPVVMAAPDAVKRPVFEYMIRYSLGLTGDWDRNKQ